MPRPREDAHITCPPDLGHREFDDAAAAVRKVKQLYEEAAGFLQAKFSDPAACNIGNVRYRAFYPELRFKTCSHAEVDSRLAYGHVSEPAEYSATITRPDLFDAYLERQIGLLIKNHNRPISVGYSSTPIPLHFAIGPGSRSSSVRPGGMTFTLRDVFDVPELATTHDGIVNCLTFSHPDGSKPLSLFSAQRVDYSIARLKHYTATSAEHFQSFVLFTNYQYYVDEFEAYARKALADKDSGYQSLVTPGDHELADPSGELPYSDTLPQMPAYHLKRPDRKGITLVNIGIGPSNAKTATDHIAVLRPHAWLMVGHCAGLQPKQQLGDYVLAHAYLRTDGVLDDDLPSWVPVPALAEVQKALEQAVAEVTQYEGYNLKGIMRTGTVATTGDRNWELSAHSRHWTRLSQSRAIALDMESATVAANGYRYRVPYGTLLCVSDKPLHGELKLPGMANDFYKRQVGRHLRIGIQALESLRRMPMEFLHSRKLRSFEEPAFR